MRSTPSTPCGCPPRRYGRAPADTAWLVGYSGVAASIGSGLLVMVWTGVPAGVLAAAWLAGVGAFYAVGSWLSSGRVAHTFRRCRPEDAPTPAVHGPQDAPPSRRSDIPTQPQDAPATQDTPHITTRERLTPKDVLAAVVVLAIAGGVGILLTWALETMPMSPGPVLR